MTDDRRKEIRQRLKHSRIAEAVFGKFYAEDCADLMMDLEAEEAETTRLLELFALVPHAYFCPAPRRGILGGPACNCIKSKVLRGPIAPQDITT